LHATYVREHVELAYATTVHGAQGETVPTAHLLLGETTGAAAAYVGMTRGRNRNTAHLVADTLQEARSHWLEVFSRNRADLGPGHAVAVAEEAIERYGPKAPDYAIALQAAALRRPEHRAGDHPVTAPDRHRTASVADRGHFFGHR
jgi:exodeoxyribonuclease V alpha subunit